MKKTKNLIVTYTQIIPKSLCKKTIDFFDKNASFESGIVNEKNDGQINKEIRNSKEMNLFFGNPKHALGQELCDLIKPLINDYFNEFNELFNTVGQTVYEDAHLLRYEPNVGFYKFHYDTGGETIDGRLLSCIIYLNNVKKGGETEFKYIESDPVAPKQGDVIIFPSGPEFTHRGNIPKSGPKYICVFWLQRKEAFEKMKTASLNK